MKITAVVILYHSNDSVVSNIETYYNSVDKIYVFDNSETETGLKEKLLKYSKIQFFHDGLNQGIAVRLNTACEIALREGFDWILTMDQDTRFCDESIANYLKCIEQYEKKEKVAAFGTKHGRKVEANTSECMALETHELITSGMVLNLSLFQLIGRFDEALFIDYVDFDYCIRAKMAGFSVIKFDNVSIYHELGKPVSNASIKTLFLWKKKKFIHSPLRCYYMYRNMLYLEKKFKETNPKFAEDTRRDILGRIKVCKLYGLEAKTITKYTELAERDFENNKMGKIDDVI